MTAQDTILVCDDEPDVRSMLASGAQYCGLYADLATIHALRGRHEPALNAMERAVEGGWWSVRHHVTER